LKAIGREAMEGGRHYKRIEELGGWEDGGDGGGGITFLVTSWWQRRRNGFTRGNLGGFSESC